MFYSGTSNIFFLSGGGEENTHVTYMMHNCPFLFLFSNCTNDHNLENIGGGGGGGSLPPPLAGTADVL